MNGYHFVVVVPFDGEGFWLIEQYRYPVKKRSLEFPQGTYPEGMDGDSLDLAKLELRQETGLCAGKMQKVGFLYGAPGISSQGFNIFLASELSLDGEPDLEVEEADLTQARYSLNEFTELIQRGSIIDATTIAAFHLVSPLLGTSK